MIWDKIILCISLMKWKGTKKKTPTHKNKLHIDIQQHRSKSKLTMVKAARSCCGRFFEKKPQTFQYKFWNVLNLYLRLRKITWHTYSIQGFQLLREKPLWSLISFMADASHLPTQTQHWMCLLYIHTVFSEDCICALSVFPCLFLCMMCVACMHVCVIVSGGSNQRGWCFV